MMKISAGTGQTSLRMVLPPGERNGLCVYMIRIRIEQLSTTDSDSEPDRHQNFTVWANLYRCAKFRRNPFITCWDTDCELSVHARLPNGEESRIV